MLERIGMASGKDMELGTAAAGNIMSESNVLTGEAAYDHSRAVVHSEVLAVSEPALRELIAADHDLGDLLSAMEQQRIEAALDTPRTINDGHVPAHERLHG